MKLGRTAWIALGVSVVAVAFLLGGKEMQLKAAGYATLAMLTILSSPRAAVATAICLLLVLAALFARRRSIRWTTGGLALLLVLAGTAFLWWPALTEKSMTYEDVKGLKFRVLAKDTGIAFDIPVPYSYNEMAVERFGNWPHPGKDEAEGKIRRAVDYVVFRALYPEMAPYTKGNAAEFRVRGLGRAIKANITHPMFPDGRSWQGLFDHTYPRLKRLAESSQVPGMIRFQDSDDELYLSHDYADDDLIIMKCSLPGLRKYPSCHVKQVATIAGARFRLEYWFSRDYLPQWRGIDGRVKSLFEQFAADAARKSAIPLG